MAEKRMQIIGVDTGGTFTDFAYLERGRVRVLKVPSSRANPAGAVISGLDTLGLRAGELVHGSTVATNALLERRGARTALVTTAGFEDLIEIGRQNRLELYNLVARKPESLVPRSLRFGITDRVLPDGEVSAQPTGSELDHLAARLRKKKVESVALCLLFSFVNPANERRVAAHLRKRGFSVSASCEVLAEFREYERLSTTAINAYASPVLERHIDALLREDAVPALRVMMSNGGSLPAEEARAAAARTILSGPAAGVIAARRVADAAGHKNIISLDMGGTSTDACLSRGGIPFTSNYICAGLPARCPVIDIHTVGAGGGSVARLDAGGALQVGPQSAGCDPGPACYGKGKLPALTDANLLMGRLPASGLLGGWMPLDAAAARRAVGKLASRAGMDVEELAEGIVAVADSGVEQALRLISVERGHDPREFVLVAFGGAGPVHGASLMARLDLKAVLVPPSPGVFSACGLLFADAVRDYSRTVFQPTGDLRGGYFFYLLEPLKRKADSDLTRTGVKKSDVQYVMSADMRYAGQSYELNIPMQKRLEEAFHAAHEREYGYADRGRQVEIVTVRLRTIVRRKQPPMRRKRTRKAASGEQALVGSQRMRWAGKWHEACVYERGRLHPGNRIAGPALVAEYSATTVVPPGCTCRVDGYNNLIIEKTR